MIARYQLLHKTTYDFAEWVPSCELEAQLRPRPQPGLSCPSHLVAVIPPAQSRETTSDRFGNPVERIVIRRRLRRLVVSATTTVDVASVTAKAFDAANIARASLPAVENAWAPDDATRSACVAYAAPALASGGSRLDGVARLARQINRDMTYDPRIIDVGRPVVALLRDRRGMCQDYVRLAVAALRAHDIPCRWVVGYVLPGSRRNPAPQGAYCWLHAWFSVFVPERGWVDFDATEPSGDAGDLLTLAWGAGEAEVNPLRGELAVEVSRQKLVVDIVIERLDRGLIAGRPVSSNGHYSAI